MQRANRHRTIIASVRGGEEVRAADLVRATGASAMTIRRDLSELEQCGLLRRTHGGAVGLPARGMHLPYEVRRESHVEEKRAIGRAAAALIPDGSSVIIDDGTTCTAVAQALAGRDVTVLALSLHIAVVLARDPGAAERGTRVLTPGGELNAGELSWSGHRAVRDIEGFRADVGVLGVCGWDEYSGMTASTVQDADVKRAIRSSSREIIAAAGADKLGVSATFAVCATEEIGTVVTGELRLVQRLWLEHSGVDVVTVG
ncbi:DeoR/GlpR family DNA-binding transcription regulator [Nesterenkonia sp. HG001]|uniref:DeoR/GlpR family DNA-binding transcription regulator n=1 Tax=Nesterenkonia sp. HG001 TaxID=2983207 RepID=UPI002AC577A5|nr:DeoR/GlpR family DNA-binding transcription regulator [Nesterenkonia sp. HG001]MDZ5078335.1 DeoR/GlpR family DNA-binding transcription regulator [Nesterenkonia sp. HG001]